MKKFFTWVLILGASLVLVRQGIRDSQPAPTPLPLVLYHLKDSSVTVATEDGFGSGVMVSRKDMFGHVITFVWTAGHVVTSGDGACTNITVINNAGESVPAEIIARQSGPKDTDIAVLRVKRQDWTTNSVIFSHDLPPVLGTQVYHIGSFYGPAGHHSLSIGWISYLNRKADDATYDQVSCPTFPGSSGGGYFLANGDCIGLADARAAETIGFIVPTRTVAEWAKNHNVQYAFDPAFPWVQ